MQEKMDPFFKCNSFTIDGREATTEELQAMQAGDNLCVFRNNLYVVNRTELPCPFTDAESARLFHLSIRRIDREAVHDWRHFQIIKNELVDPQAEGVELYPAESRLVDTANQYHLWVLMGVQFPFGYGDRLVSESGDDIGAVQRPWPEGQKPDDESFISREQVNELLERGSE